MPNFGIVWFVVYYHRTGLIQNLHVLRIAPLCYDIQLYNSRSYSVLNMSTLLVSSLVGGVV